jgi:hypothetical protein
MSNAVATIPEQRPRRKRTSMVNRKEKPVAAPAREERDAHLKAETQSGRRLQAVKIEDGALILHGTEEAQRRVNESFGSQSREFQTYCITQLISILPEAAAQETNDYTLPMNAAVAMLEAINPKNELEAMLAVQMIATHHLALKTARLTGGAKLIPQLQANGNLATKFARTFTAQLEALDRHRRGGKQIVEHVHVNAGGQAVIAGTVNTGAGG